MPLPFRRKSAAATEDPIPAREVAAGEELEAQEVLAGEEPEGLRRPKGYTPSKKELGVTTPKRPNAHVRRPGTPPPSRARKQMTKEERQALREERRERRRHVTEGIRRGDPKYLTARDQGPERALVRDVVDSRRTVGTWFFAGALIVLLGSSTAMPDVVRLISNVLWAALALAVILDSVIICRKAKRLVRERHPDSTERMGSLYLYAVMRAITFRKLRVPQPRVKFGDTI